MTTFTIHAAKTNLSKLIARAEAGEEIVLTRGTRPVARIVRTAPETEASSKKRQLGGYDGVFSFDEAVFKPLTDQEMKDYGFV